MPQKKFSLEAGGPPRLEVSWRGGFKDLSVSLDGQPVASFEGPKELKDPQRVSLPDGSTLEVQVANVFVIPELRLTRDGEPTERVTEAALDNRLIQQYADIIFSPRPKSEVAILTDPDSALLMYAANGTEQPSTSSFRGYYRALWNIDLSADFIQPNQLAGSGYKVIIAPWHLVGKAATCEALVRLVNAGCTLILETSTGLFDERFFANPIVPPHGLAEEFGYREGESFYIPSETDEIKNKPVQNAHSDRIYDNPEIEFSTPVAISVKANTYLTPIQTTSATVIGACQGFPVAARKAVGRGQVYYFGTNLGASISAGDDRGIELLRAVIWPVVRPPVTAGNLRPRLVSGAKRALMVVVNDTVEEQTSRIVLPVNYSRATDIHSEKTMQVAGNAIDFFEGANVRICNVENVDVISDASSIRGGIVRAKNIDLRKKAAGSVEYARDEVGFHAMMFAKFL